MNLDVAESMANNLMYTHGLIQNGWTFHWIRAVRAFGRCSWMRRRILLSRPMTQINSEYEVRDTILHEIAHALAGPDAHHGDAWKRQAREIGARPETCYSTSQVMTIPQKWVATCPGCGIDIHRHRRPRQALAHTPCRRKGLSFEELTLQWRRA